MLAEPNSGPRGSRAGGRAPFALLVPMLHGCFRWFEWLVRATARAENAIFHKGNGLETPSSEFSGLRMRDGVPSPVPLSCARPDRAEARQRGCAPLDSR